MDDSARRRWLYYGAAVLLAAGWYALLGTLGFFADFVGGAHLAGAALFCGGLLAARLARGFLSRTRGPAALLATVMAVALGWILSVTAYAVFFFALSNAPGVEHPPPPTFVPWAIMAGMAVSGWIMAVLWYLAVPLLVFTLIVTYWAARTLRPSDGQ